MTMPDQKQRWDSLFGVRGGWQRTPEGVGDGLGFEAGHEALRGLDQELEGCAAKHGALRPSRAGRLQLGQPVQRRRHIHLVKYLDPLRHLVQDLHTTTL